MTMRELLGYVWRTIKILWNPNDPPTIQFVIDKPKRTKKAKRNKEIEYIKLK